MAFRVELGRVQGLVLRDGDSPQIVANARLRLRHYKVDFEKVETTDRDGYFGFTTVPSGDYTLTVDAEGLFPSEVRVRVRQDRHLEQVVVFTLPSREERCHTARAMSWREAQRLQRTALRAQQRRSSGPALAAPR